MYIKKSRIYRIYNELGAINGLLYLLDILLRSTTKSGFIRRYYIVSQPVKVDIIKIENKPRNFILRRLTATCHDVIDQMPRDNILLHQRLLDNAFCFYSMNGGHLSGMLWFRKYSYTEDEVSCIYRLSPPDVLVWDFDVFIDKKYRMGVLFYKLWNEAMIRLMADGIKYTVSRISAFNTNSVRSHQRLGASIVGVITFLVIKNYQITMIGKWPFILVTGFSGGRKPVLYIDVDREGVTLGLEPCSEES